MDTSVIREMCDNGAVFTNKEVKEFCDAYEELERRLYSAVFINGDQNIKAGEYQAAANNWFVLHQECENLREALIYYAFNPNKETFHGEEFIVCKPDIAIAALKKE